MPRDFDEDVNEKIFSISLRMSAVTILNLYKAIKKKQLENQTGEIESGEISEEKLKEYSDNLRSIDFSNDPEDIALFDEVARFYNVRYALKQDMTDPEKVVIFFEAKNEQRINECLKKFTEVVERSQDLEAGIEQTEEKPRTVKDKKEKEKQENKEIVSVATNEKKLAHEKNFELERDER